MYFGFIDRINKNKLLSKLLAIVSVLAISSVSVEAARTSHKLSSKIRKKVHHRVKKTRLKKVRVRKARVRRGRTAKAHRLSPRQLAARQALLLRQQQATTHQAEILHQQQQTAAAAQAEILRQQQTAAAEHQAEILRQQQAAALQAAAARTARIAEQYRVANLRNQQVDPIAHNRLRTTPFQPFVHGDVAHPYSEFAKFEFPRTQIVGPDPANPGDFLVNLENYPTIDIGYTPALATLADPDAPLKSTGRSEVYALNIPNATAIYLYNPSGGNVIGDYQAPSYLFNATAAYSRRFASWEVHRELGDVQDANIKAHVMALYLPRLLPGSGRFLLRPQHCVEPDAPYQVGAIGSANRNDRYNHVFQISTGIFSSQPGGPRLMGQPIDELLQDHVSLHNSDNDTPGRLGVIIDPKLVSSGARPEIENLDNQTRVFYSVTKWLNPATNVREADVVRYISLNAVDRDIVENIIPGANNLDDLKNQLIAAPLSRPVGRYFDPYEPD